MLISSLYYVFCVTHKVKSKLSINFSELVSILYKYSGTDKSNILSLSAVILFD